MGWWPFGRDREVTSVGIESEITIPWMAYVVKCICGIIFITGCLFIGWLIWLYDFLSYGTVKEWVPLWLAWIRRNWPLLPMLYIVWCITLPLLMLFFRMSIEQIFKAWMPVDLWGKWFGRINDK